MEYIFGTKGETEILKTKGAAHTDITGFRQIEQIYADQSITDYFRVVCKYDSKEDDEGNCYDWYEIDRHYRVVDKSAPVSKMVAESAAAIENALCEQDSMLEERMRTIEDAMCELDAMIGKEGSV